MKRNKVIYLLVGILVIIILWLIYWLLISKYIPDEAKRAQFGEMFGAINSLFSGLALCGVAYTVYLQFESNKSSVYQFKFNHLLDTVNRQVDIFNNRIEEFYFKDLRTENTVLLKFDKSMEYYVAIKNNTEVVNKFIELNDDVISAVIPFLYYSNKFIYDLIDKEALLDDDKIKLKSLYSRSQNRRVTDFLSLNTKALLKEKLNLENTTEDLKEIHHGILKKSVEMAKAILSNDYR